MIKHIITLMLLALVSSISFSQLSKEEKKEWKKKLKTAGVEGFKTVTEEKEAAEAKVSSLTSEVSTLENNIADLESDVSDYKRAAKESADKLAESEAKLDSLKGNTVSANGTSFKVQIGAYKEFDLSSYFNNHKNFGGEIDDDGTMKYTLGQFNNYPDAQTFKKLMVEMGVKGAWIVAYKNGRRIDMQEALNQ